MRTILLSIVLLCAVACTPTQQPQQAQSNINASFLSDTEADSINNMQNVYAQKGQILTVAKQPIKVGKKRNCSAKQTFEGARGGVFHYDTAKNGNVYKHYAK